MKIKTNELLTTWKNFGLLDFPRMMGNPIQVPVYTAKQFLGWFKANCGRAICFTSHNSYPKLNDKYRPPKVEAISVNNIFVDLDDDKKIENAQNDAIKLIDFCEKENLTFCDQFSGRKGFHHFIRLKPETYLYNDALKIRTRAVQNWLKEELNLRTIDERCKDATRLCRIPFSKHASQIKGTKCEVSKTFCYPLKSDEIRDKSVTEIVKNAEKPHPFIYTNLEPTLTLREFIEHFSIDLEKYSTNIKMVEGKINKLAEYEKVPADDFHLLIKNIIPRKCIHNDLFKPNPTHTARRLAVIQLKDIGYDFTQIIQLFEKMTEEFKWVDRMNQSKRIYQIKHIFFHNPPYNHDTCGTIKEYGLCVGEKCEKFRGW